MQSFLLAVFSALCFTVGGLFMKYSAGFTRMAPTCVAFVLYIAGASFQILLLRRTDLGVSYVFVLGLEAVLAFALGILFFREPVPMSRVIGVLLIVAGILFLKSKSPSQPTKDQNGANTRAHAQE